MSTNNINIRLTIHFNPNIPEIINYTTSASAIEMYLFPWLKDKGFYNQFIFHYSENWSEKDLFDICKYILKLFYS
jgi:hypothetical protein